LIWLWYDLDMTLIWLWYDYDTTLICLMSLMSLWSVWNLAISSCPPWWARFAPLPPQWVDPLYVIPQAWRHGIGGEWKGTMFIKWFDLSVTYWQLIDTYCLSCTNVPRLISIYHHEVKNFVYQLFFRCLQFISEVFVNCVFTFWHFRQLKSR
jgi:hypothetical protein